jgi:hypothetical protein
LGDAYERSRRTTSVADYENILWNSLERGLAAALKGAKELVIVADGLDEASCGEATLLKKLIAVTTNSTNVKLITLGAEKPAVSENVMHVPVSEDQVADDISTVVRSNLIHSHSFLELSELHQETIVDQISEASHGSFLWAKLCTKRARHEHTPDNLRKAVETIINSKPTITDFVLHSVQSPEVSEDAKYMLLWLATTERPLLLKELVTLASIQTDKHTITDRKLDPLQVLQPLNSLVFLQDGRVYLRHGLIRTAVLDVFSKGKLTPTIKDRHVDFVTRLLIYIKSTVTENHEPALTPLDRHDTTALVSKHSLLDFAVRYWPLHLKQTSVFKSGGETSTAKEFPSFDYATVAPKCSLAKHLNPSAVGLPNHSHELVSPYPYHEQCCDSPVYHLVGSLAS